LDERGRYTDAELFFERAQAIFEKALGPEHLKVATNLTNLAALYYTQGQYAKAEPVFERVLAIRERVLGPEHPEVAKSLHNLAVLYQPKVNTRRPSPFTIVRWRFLKRPWNWPFY
jgi:tetratricopeptide (TPR) repeat protein